MFWFYLEEQKSYRARFGHKSRGHRLDAVLGPLIPQAVADPELGVHHQGHVSHHEKLLHMYSM